MHNNENDQDYFFQTIDSNFPQSVKKPIDKSSDDLNIKLDFIINELKDIKDMCKKMSEHIDFVDDTYQTLKKPIDFIKNQVNSLYIEDNK